MRRGQPRRARAMCQHATPQAPQLALPTGRFFWGYGDTWPLPELSGQQNIVRLVRRSQLAQVLDNYTAVVRLEHVYLEPDHTRFHLFRKLIRCGRACSLACPRPFTQQGPSHHALRRAVDMLWSPPTGRCWRSSTSSRRSCRRRLARARLPRLRRSLT